MSAVVLSLEPRAPGFVDGRLDDIVEQGLTGGLGSRLECGVLLLEQLELQLRIQGAIVFGLPAGWHSLKSRHDSEGTPIFENSVPLMLDDRGIWCTLKSMDNEATVDLCPQLLCIPDSDADLDYRRAVSRGQVDRLEVAEVGGDD